MKKSNKEDLMLSLPLFFMVLVGIVILGCIIYQGYENGSRVVISREYKNYEVVGINPPKHFYLDLKETKTGYVYKHIYVSKHCNNWRKLPLHSVFMFEEVIYKYEKKPDHYVDININGSQFCNNL